MKKIVLIGLLFCSRLMVNAQEADSLELFMETLEADFKYQYGTISFDNGIGTLNVPEGFKYLDPTQTEKVLTELWGNPSGDGTLGMIIPEEQRLLDATSWAFIVTYDEMGFVKDDDADEIDYDDLLSELQADAAAANEERESLGYESVSLVGWASKPYYDQDKKVLHWAKELKFGEEGENTLNYNIRILGRKGVLVLNAVALMSSYSEVEQNIEPVMASFSFSDGNRYGDFNPEIDQVAAWTVGGLVAGKVLTKVGFLAFLLKYIKLIGIALVAAGTGLWRWFKSKTEPPVVRNLTGENNADA